jgi:hypothetical protein
LKPLIVIARLGNNGVRPTRKRRMHVKVVVYNELAAMIVDAAMAHGCPHVIV